MFAFSAELLALLLLVLLGLHFYEARRTPNRSIRMYWACLIFSAASILLNASCVLSIRYAHALPLALNLLLNSAYFLVNMLVATFAGLFLFERLLVHVYDDFCIRRARALLFALLGVGVLLVLVNLSTGVLFYFDASRRYCRGPLNAAGYVLALIELAMLGLCYLRHRHSVDKFMRRVIYVLPPVTLMLIVFQRLFPALLLNGTILAYAALILLLNFQSQKIEIDALTGLGLLQNFLGEITLRRSGSQPFHVLAVSLTHFSMVNARFGYARGDEFLYVIARWMEKNLPDAHLYRLGPVTFAALFPGSEDAQAAQRAALLHARFTQPWELGALSYTLPAVVYDLQCGGEAWTPQEIAAMLAHARRRAIDERLPYLHIDCSVAADVARRAQLSQYLRTAIDTRRLEVYYQPIYHVSSDSFQTAEALVRLRGTDGRPIPPDEFIPLAEQQGMIDEITWLVLEQTCLLLTAPDTACLRAVSVNVTMPQLADDTFLPRLQQLLTQHALTPDRLRLEITERELMANEAGAQQLVAHMAAQGFSFYLDDFGTGYSNFARMLRFSLQAVKLDKSLIVHLQTDEKYAFTIRSLVELFRHAGMHVVAEGIETRQQAEQLQTLGVDQLQGYLYARPMDAAQLARFLRT